MSAENQTQNPYPGDDLNKGLVHLIDFPQLYHSRDAAEDVEPWRVSATGTEDLSSNVHSGVFYLTPYPEEAAHHVRNAVQPSIHAMDIVNDAAVIMDGGNFHPNFAATLRQRVSEVIKPDSELNSLALAKLSSANQGDYLYKGAFYSLERNITEFALKTVPEGVDLREWEVSIQTYLSAMNAQRLIGTGQANMILQGVLDYVVNPNITLVYGEVGYKENGDSVSAWFPVNRQYLMKALSSKDIVGFTKTINRFGTSTDPGLTGTSVVFNDAVMLWLPEVTQTSGTIDAEQTKNLVSAARAAGRIPLKANIQT